VVQGAIRIGMDWLDIQDWPGDDDDGCTPNSESEYYTYSECYPNAISHRDSYRTCDPNPDTSAY